MGSLGKNEEFFSSKYVSSSAMSSSTDILLYWMRRFVTQNLENNIFFSYQNLSILKTSFRSVSILVDNEIFQEYQSLSTLIWHLTVSIKRNAESEHYKSFTKLSVSKRSLKDFKLKSLRYCLGKYILIFHHSLLHEKFSN